MDRDTQLIWETFGAGDEMHRAEAQGMIWSMIREYRRQGIHPQEIYNRIMEVYGVHYPDIVNRAMEQHFVHDKRADKWDLKKESTEEQPLVDISTQTVGDEVPMDLLHTLSMFDNGVMRADEFFNMPEASQLIDWGWVDSQPTQDPHGNQWVSLTDKGFKTARSGTISQ